jgi:glucose-1-phosphate thymidylyltransferase
LTTSGHFRADTLPLIDQYLDEGNNPDQAGHLIAWLVDRVEVYGIPVSGDWIDVRTPETYQQAQIGIITAPSKQL